MDNDQIIQEATEAVTKGLPCAFYVPLLLDVIKEQKASIDILGEANGKIAVAYQNAKSEAYREFAERFAETFFIQGVTWSITKEEFEDFVKELAEK